MESLDDLFSGGPAPSPQPSEREQRRALIQEDRERRQRAATQSPDNEHEAMEAALAAGGALDISMLKRPMTLTNIATLLGKEPRRVVGLLEKCPSVGTTKYKGKTVNLYDLKDAINYLATPKAEHIMTWVKSQSSATLPPFFHKAFWEGEDKRMTVLEKAGDLWRTDDVQSALGEVAKTVNDSTRLWVERLPGVLSMSTEQYESFRQQVTDLQQEIYDLITKRMTEHRVRSHQGEVEQIIDELVGPADTVDDVSLS